MTSEEDYYAACPACMSLVSRDDRNSAEETAEQHNDSSHDGDLRAIGMNARDADELNDFLILAREESSGEEYENFVNRMHYGNTPFFCPSSLYRDAVPNEDQ